MVYVLAIFILCSGYYTLTFGLYMWKRERNKLGGFGAILLAAAGTIWPIIIMFIRL